MKQIVDQIKKNPLARALRIDKMTLAALEAVLRLYRNPATLTQYLPGLRQLTRPTVDIETMAARLIAPLAGFISPHYEVSIRAGFSQIGSGALPVETLESVVITIAPVQPCDSALRQLSAALRALPCPVIGRTQKGEVLLDLRCMDDEKNFIAQLQLLTGL